MKYLGLAPTLGTDLVTKAYADSTYTGGGGGSTATGAVKPVQVHTNGSETYTISGGAITAISGPQIQYRTVNVGDRILVTTAPAASGSGSLYSRTSQPANGIYVADSVGATINVSRATDFASPVQPAGLLVFSENTGGDWQNNSLFAVQYPNGPWHNWNVDNIYFVAIGGASLNPNNLFVNDDQIGFWNNTPGISTYLNVNPAATSGADQQLTLPGITTATLLSRTVTVVTSTLTLAAATGNEYIYLLKTGAIPTLPTAVGNTAYYRIKNTTTGNIVLKTTSSQTIDGSTTITIRPNIAVDLVSDNANWFVL